MYRTCFLLWFSLFSFSCSEQPAETATSNPSAEAVTSQKERRNVILFFGDSITAGYGLEPSEGYTALLQRRLDSLGMPYTVVNAGISGETSAGGLGRIDWALKQPVDIFVLELGANDGLRGIDPATTRKNLDSIFQKVRLAYPSAKLVLAGMKVPPSMGNRYAVAFEKTFTDVATKHDATLIPFLLEGVGGEPELNQKDGIHPNAEGARIVAETVWRYLELR
jgi:acyl-CoA thioesterase-1